MTKLMQVDYYYTLMSPWAYFGAPRFYSLQKKYKFEINHLPLDIISLFSLTGGVPLAQRTQQRKNYRMIELKRWQKKLKMPINFLPKYFPPSDVSKASAIIMSLDDNEKRNAFSFACLKYIWVEEKDIGDEKNLISICNRLKINYDKLLKKIDSKIKLYKSNAKKAADKNIFGSPTYVINKEIFWGQDRLDLFEDYIINYTN